MNVQPNTADVNGKSRTVLEKTVLRGALDLATAGYRVFPAGNNKRPACEGGFYAATMNTDLIQRWAAEGRMKHIAIATGLPSGVVVTDADDEEALAAMIARYGEPHVRSRRGGHWYWKHPGNGKVASGPIGADSRHKLLPGNADSKADGAYVLAPPSPGKSWTAGVPDPESLPVLPTELRPPASTPPIKGTAALPEDLFCAGVNALAANYPEPGVRHEAGMPIAGFLMNSGVSAEDVYNLMLEARSRLPKPVTADTERSIRGVVETTARRIANGENVTGGRTLEQLVPGLAQGLYEALGLSKKAPKTAEAADQKRNQADRLIDYAMETGAELFVDHLRAPHALVDGEPLPLNSRCYPWLRELMWERERRSATVEALKQTAGTLAAFALHSGIEHELHTRAAVHEGAVYYQLGKGRVVEIDANGWRVLRDRPPVLFRAISNLKELPTPVAGGSLEPLHDLVNIKDRRDRRLFDAYMTLLPLADIPRPMLQPTGIQGSGKSTLSRVVKRTLDPTAPEAVRMDPRDFLQKASHAYIVMLDNQNALPEWAADTLCRLVTGESDSKRQLYTDDEDVIVEMLRAILINGINTPSDRGDVQERTLPLELEPIPKNRRQPERVMWAKFQRTHRSVLGAIFSGLSGAMARHRKMTFGELPRLADWAEYAMALYEHWGWGQQTFVKDWAEVEGRQVQGAVEGSPVAQAIIGLMREHDSYKKSSSGLLEKLEAAADRLNIDVKREKTWPKSPSWLWRRIQEIKPALAANTIYAERGEDNSGSYILLTKGAPPEDDGGGSRNGSGSISRYAATDAATVDPAYTAENGGSGSKNGHLSPSTLVPIEENGHVEHESGPKEHSPREVPENAATAAMLPPADDDEYVDGPAAIDVEGEDWTYMPGDDVEFDESRYITDQAGLDRVREELDLSPAPAEPELPPLPEGENPDDWFAIQYYFAGENSGRGGPGSRGRSTRTMRR